MAKDQIDKLEEKKQQLQNELDELHNELDNTFDDVSAQLNPKTIIRKYPLPIVGASALLGFLLGHKRNSSDKSDTSNNKSVSTDGGFTSALLSELKRRATRRAVSFATDYVEDLLEKKAEKHLSSTNGEEE